VSAVSAVPLAVAVKPCGHCTCSAPEKQFECAFCGACRPLAERELLGGGQRPACRRCSIDLDRCPGCDSSGTAYVMDPQTGRMDPEACGGCEGFGYTGAVEPTHCAICNRFLVCHPVYSTTAEGEDPEYACYGCVPEEGGTR
jgi:hypothetical protein